MILGFLMGDQFSCPIMASFGVLPKACADVVPLFSTVATSPDACVQGRQGCFLPCSRQPHPPGYCRGIVFQAADSS